MIEKPHVTLSDIHPALGLFVTRTHSRAYQFFRGRIRRIVADLAQRNSAICEPYDACDDGTWKSDHATNAHEQTNRRGRSGGRWDWGGCQRPLARLSGFSIIFSCISYLGHGTGTSHDLKVFTSGLPISIHCIFAPSVSYCIRRAI